MGESRNNQFYFLLFSIFAVLTFSECRTTKGLKHKYWNPPNTLRIEENLFADETEISNSAYRLYVDWTERIYGTDSQEYLSAFPHFDKVDCFTIPGTEYLEYFFKAKTDDAPVVGISLEQAIDYTKWRTERVQEMALIVDGYINYNPNTRFTLEKYINGELDNIVRHKDIFLPFYRLPNKYEWQKILNSTVEKKDPVYLPQEKIDTFFAYQNLAPSIRGRHSQSLEIHHLNGNVTEWVGIGESMGSSWTDSVTIDPTIVRKVDTLNCWTGFRNVASFFEVKVKKKNQSE